MIAYIRGVRTRARVIPRGKLDDKNRSDFMSKRNTLKKTAALLMSLALTIGATGCNFLVTDNELDLKQVSATVDITDELANGELSAVKSDVDKLIADKSLATDVLKRDLVAYFVNVGINYVQNYGYSYKDVFELLMQDLANQKVLTQYAVAYYLANGSDEEDGHKTFTAQDCIDYVNEQIEAETNAKTKELYKAHRDVLGMKYFLTEEEYNETVYTLMQSLNAALDEAETSYIKFSDDHAHEEARTMPTNVNALEDEYVPMKDGALNYDVYTGRNALTSCGTYEKVDGSTASTRKKAYNMFLSNLQSYGLVDKIEDTALFTELDYYYVELASALGKAVANKYLTSLQDKAIEALEANNYQYVANKYNEIKASQESKYTETPSSFESAIGSISDESFVLYGYKNFGFVYNILLPFDVAQEQAYSAMKNKGLKGDALFNARKALLAEVQAKDLRTTWFGEDDHTHYAYQVSKANSDKYYGSQDSAYLFFKDNMTNNDQYKKLGQYLGEYPYNGTAVENDDGEWEFTPNKLSINGFIQEMESYINYALGGAKASGNLLTSYNTDVYTTNNVVDYSKFMYYEGKVDLTNTSCADFFFAGDETRANDSYTALSAVNELMFAYSTDTGCLNTYQGYVVSPYKTSFVSEFEYAAQYAVNKGVGTYVVAPSDYGWHIIYVAFVYDADNGDVYGSFDYNDIEKEGTFSNLFYESIKSTSVSNYTSEVQGVVLNAYKNSTTLFTKTYQDLLDMD